MHSRIPPSTHLSIEQFIHLSHHLSACLFVHYSNHLSILQSMHPSLPSIFMPPILHRDTSIYRPSLLNRRRPEVQVPALLHIPRVVDDELIELFDSNPSLRVVAPGRVILMREHRDYNEGYVLPMARTHKDRFIKENTCTLVSLHQWHEQV